MKWNVESLDDAFYIKLKFGLSAIWGLFLLGFTPLYNILRLHGQMRLDLKYALFTSVKEKRVKLFCNLAIIFSWEKKKAHY